VHCGVLATLENARSTRHCQETSQLTGAACPVFCDPGYARYTPIRNYRCTADGNWYPKLGEIKCIQREEARKVQIGFIFY